MKITKAVITAAGPDQRALPLQELVDRDGARKSALRINLEEIFGSGVEEVCVVVGPGDSAAYAKAAGASAGRLAFVEQPAPLGYGHALYCARGFTGDHPFLHLVGDHLFLHRGGRPCARQVVEAAEAESCAVSAVQATRETMLPYYGVVGGHRASGRRNLYEVERVAEKPTPTEAEQTLVVPGLRAGHYLCFFGIHVLTPAVMELLGARVGAAEPGRPLPLSGALAELARREKYLARFH